MNIYKKIRVNWVIIGLLSLMLMACSSDDSELTHYINSVKTRPARPIEPIPETQPLEKFIYPEQDSRRSPFKPVVDLQDTFAPNIKRPKQPLEHFPLDALKFVGILKEGQITWALISQPSGLISRVQVGDYMGQNYGQIIYIKDKTIQLEETVQVNGKWEKKKIIIDLRSPEEDKNKRGGLAK
jgi:type IV pilus assembly protein PilP